MAGNAKSEHPIVPIALSNQDAFELERLLYVTPLSRLLLWEQIA